MEDSEELRVIAANSGFYAALSGSDIVAMNALWAEGGELAVLHPGWDMIEGREEIMRSWKNIFSDPQGLDIEFGNGTVEFTEDEAVVKGSEFMRSSVTKVVNVFRKQADGDWQMVFHGAEEIHLPSPGHA